jgi:hypothetical protein
VVITCDKKSFELDGVNFKGLLRQIQIENIHLKVKGKSNQQSITIGKIKYPCPNWKIRIERRIYISSLLAEEGLKNAFLASMERNMFEMYQNFSYKMSPYSFFNPYDSIGQFSSSILGISSSTFLGLFEIPENRYKLANLFAKESYLEGYVIGKINIPFSPMLSSSLTTVILFSLYFFIIILLYVRMAIIAVIRKLVSGIDLDQALFTAISLSITLIFTFIIAFDKFVNIIWKIFLN